MTASPPKSSETDVALRHVSEPDRLGWRRLFDAYAAFYGVTVGEAEKDAVWSWIFDPSAGFWAVVAEREGVLIGLTQYQRMKRSLGGGDVIYLSDLYVSPAARGGGVGRRLIDHVVEHAGRLGAPSVRWLTQEFNYDARKLYDAFAPKSDFILYNIPTTPSGS